MADVVLSSNAIFTGNSDELINGGVAVKDNRILAVGTMKEINPYISSATKIINFKDQLMMPGFHDFHIHLFLGSLSKDSVSLSSADSEEEAAQMVKDFADLHSDDDWIFGFNWYHVYWKSGQLPHRSTLDKLIPNRPVFLLNDECHGAWVNSKALELMGIDQNTPDPPFGEIVRDEQGEATGFLYETAMTFAQEAFNTLPKQKQRRLLQDFQQYASKLGVTSVSDMLPLPGLELGNLQLYEEFEKEDKLNVRIHFLATLEGNLKQARELREKYDSEKLQFSGLKQFLDGVIAAYTALLVDPYSDDPESKGNTLIPTDYIKQWINDADKEDFRVRLHACGDGAVRLGLDCYEDARNQNGARDARHTIEHIEVIHPEDIKRFQELEVIPSMQPEHLAASETFSENVYPDRLGKERDPFTFPVKTLEDSGATVAFGTDFPVVDLNPMLEIYRAITRVHNDSEPVEGWNSKERITLANALRHYTIHSAYGNFREKDLGTLEVGKLADIIVLDRHLFEVSPEEIKEAQVALTMMDGKIVYQNKREEKTNEYFHSTT